jgi:long-chain acyl-CoA synthetase
MAEANELALLHRLWEQNWPGHLPKAPVYPLGEQPLTTYLSHWAQARPDRPAIIYYGASLTFGELDRMASAFARVLIAAGIRPGDRVAIFLPNCPAFHVAFYGILRAGAVIVPVNPMFRAEELAYELNDSEARAMVVASSLVPLVESVRSRTRLEHIWYTRLADWLPPTPTLAVHPSVAADAGSAPNLPDFRAALAAADPAVPLPAPDLDAWAALNYTGGTTGLPKGAVHTQRDMLYTAACSATFTLEARPDDVGLVYVPIFWIAGENIGVTGPVFMGTPVVLFARWDPDAVLAAVARYRVTYMLGTVDNYVELLERASSGRYDLSSIRVPLAMSFVRKLTPEYRRRWQALAGPHSVLREAAYGMTETHTIDTFTNGFTDGDRDLSTPPPVFCGLPMPGTEIRIVDFDSKEPLGLNREGEIAIRTPSLLKSYWNKPEATAEAFRDGWFLTGDIGLIDDAGCLHFLGRRKEMLKVNGMSVFPSELEALLGTHPAVLGSAVIGRPDPEKGEVPVAFVQIRPEYAETVTADALWAWCRENMAVYKVPEIRLVEHLPVTATGKVIKEELKRRLNEA